MRGMLVSTILALFVLGILLGGYGTEGLGRADEIVWDAYQFEIDRADHVLRSAHGALLNLSELTKAGVRLAHDDTPPQVMVDGEQRDDLLPQDVYVRAGRVLSYAHRSNGDVIAVWFDELTLIRQTNVSDKTTNSTTGVFVRLDGRTDRMKINPDGRTIHRGQLNQILEDDAVSKGTPTKRASNDNSIPPKKAASQSKNGTTSGNNDTADKKNTCRNVKPVKLFEIAIAFDSELCARFGGNPNDVIGALYSLITIANEPFRRSTCLKLVISHIDGYCDSQKDPYIAFKKYQNERSSRILFEIEEFWEKNRRHVHRDAMLLMSGYLHAHFWGQAFVGVTCERGGYGWVERLRRASTAHELGHLVGCTHQTEGVMKQGASIQLGTRMQFTETNIAEIVKYVDDSPYARCITYERDLKASQMPKVSPSNSKPGAASRAPFKSVSPSAMASMTMSVTASRTPVPSRLPRRTATRSPRVKATRTPSGTATGMKRSPRPSVSKSMKASVPPTKPPGEWKHRTKTCAIGFSKNVALDCKPSERGLKIWTKLGSINVDISQKYGRFVTRLQIWEDERTTHNNRTVTTLTKSTFIGYKAGIFRKMHQKWPNLGTWKTFDAGINNNNHNNANNNNENRTRKRTFFIFTRPNEIVLGNNDAESCCSKKIWLYIAVSVSKTTTVKRIHKSKPVITDKTETGKGLKRFGATLRCVDCGNRRAVPANPATAQMCPKCK